MIFKSVCQIFQNMKYFTNGTGFIGRTIPCSK